MPTERELGGLQRFQDFSFIMQNTQLSRGEVGLAKKSQQISFLICFKLLKRPVSLPLSPDGLWAIFTFIREFFFLIKGVFPFENKSQLCSDKIELKTAWGGNATESSDFSPSVSELI